MESDVVSVESSHTTWHRIRSPVDWAGRLIAHEFDAVLLPLLVQFELERVGDATAEP
jgi:hypothetical protein